MVRSTHPTILLRRTAPRFANVMNEVNDRLDELDDVLEPEGAMRRLCTIGAK